MSDYPIGKIRIKGIQCNSIGPFQTDPSSASDQLSTRNWIMLLPPPPLPKPYFSKYTYGGTCYSYVLNSIIGGGCCAGPDHLFLLQGLLPAGVIPCNQGSSIILTNQNIKAAHPAIHWHGSGTQTILSLPPPVLPDPLIRYTLPQNQATRFIDCTIENKAYQPVSRADASQKARDSQRDHWDLPDLPDNRGG